MTKNIIVVNQKGGVGKSLIADELAFSFERSHIPISFYDMDSQGGTLHKTVDTPDAQVAVIDTPGALQSELKSWIKASDLIVVPTKTTTREFDVLLRMMEIVDSYPDIPVVFVLNDVNRFKICSEFKDWFKGRTEGRIVVQIPHSEAFVQAAALGKSIVEYAPKSRSRAAKAAAEAIKELGNTVRQILGFNPEM